MWPGTLPQVACALVLNPPNARHLGSGLVAHGAPTLPSGWRPADVSTGHANASTGYRTQVVGQIVTADSAISGRVIHTVNICYLYNCFLRWVSKIQSITCQSSVGSEIVGRLGRQSRETAYPSWANRPRLLILAQKKLVQGMTTLVGHLPRNTLYRRQSLRDFIPPVGQIGREDLFSPRKA